MHDLTDRLARLGADDPSLAIPDDPTVAGDLDRGRRAARRRLVGRGAAGVGGVAAAAAIIALAVNGTSAPHHTAAAGPSRSVSSHATGQPAIRLVAYRGTQQPGFTVSSVPDGYVLQGVSGSTLDIAKADDHTPLDTFSGKLVVGIEQAMAGQKLNGQTGRPVTVNGQDGVIHTDQDATTLAYYQGHGSDNVVTVQSWSNIELTQDQIVQFAQGVTVTAAAQRQHG